MILATQLTVWFGWNGKTIVLRRYKLKADRRGSVRFSNDWVNRCSGRGMEEADTYCGAW